MKRFRSIVPGLFAAALFGTSAAFVAGCEEDYSGGGLEEGTTEPLEQAPADYQTEEAPRQDPFLQESPEPSQQPGQTGQQPDLQQPGQPGQQPDLQQPGQSGQQPDLQLPESPQEQPMEQPSQG